MLLTLCYHIMSRQASVLFCADSLFCVSKLDKVYSSILKVMCGVCAQVRMSPDNMTAFVLWDAHADHYHSASREISQRCA